MQLPWMTDVQGIFGQLFALVLQVSQALAMGKWINRDNFRCNTESRGVLLPERGPTSTIVPSNVDSSPGGNSSHVPPT